MKLKDLFGGDKKSKVEAETETKIEPAVKLGIETTIEPAVKAEAKTKKKPVV